MRIEGQAAANEIYSLSSPICKDRQRNNVPGTRTSSRHGFSGGCKKTAGFSEGVVGPRKTLVFYWT